jgi:hypothetical protein
MMVTPLRVCSRLFLKLKLTGDKLRFFEPSVSKTPFGGESEQIKAISKAIFFRVPIGRQLRRMRP